MGGGWDPLQMMGEWMKVWGAAPDCDPAKGAGAWRSTFPTEFPARRQQTQTQAPQQLEPASLA